MKINHPLEVHKARGLLEQLVQDESVTEKEYKENLRKYQLQLLSLQRKLMASRQSMIVVFEGPGCGRQGRRDQADDGEARSPQHPRLLGH